jgi:hypothetical protein
VVWALLCCDSSLFFSFLLSFVWRMALPGVTGMALFYFLLIPGLTWVGSENLGFFSPWGFDTKEAQKKTYILHYALHDL